MTRKDYRAIAAALLIVRPPEGDAAAMLTWAQDVRSIAAALLADNPRFIPGRFYRAAGLEE